MLSRNEDELVALARTGDPDAFEQLLERHMPAIRAMARRYAGTAGGADGEDLAQEGMLTLFRAVRGYKPDGGAKFATYAQTAIRNSMAAYVKRHLKSPRVDSFSDLDKPVDLASPVEDAFIKKESALWLEALLSDFERKILRLYLGGHSYNQIAQASGTTAKAVDNALQRIRRKLRHTEPGSAGS
ncbi:MAG: sigma-70 family RNA polymerase sigma factor [Oscillospiraceae bacterium]|nr:sigma-70 family RNA polymerase sigma factor [Oscillospiraceae bacterium]